MNAKTVKETFTNLPKKRKQVLLRVLAGYSKSKIAYELCNGSETAVQQNLRQLYKNFHIRGDRERNLPALISLFARCMPELLSAPIPEVLDNVEQEEAIAKPHRELVESDAGSIEERYFKATSQFDSIETLERKSRIQVLEEIAKDSPRYHWKVMEFLADFVRDNARRKEEKEGEEERSPKLRQDIQAALTVIGGRDSKKDPPKQRLDLTNIDIRGAVLAGANLQEAILIKANLQGTDLKDANLQEANLNGANLQETDLFKANLKWSKLKGANLKRVSFVLADLQEAYLFGANLERACLWSANLRGANLFGADLEEAHLSGANSQGTRLSEVNLQGATLTGVKLQGADLSGVKNLEAQQLRSTYGDSETASSLPENVKAPEHWIQPK